MKFFYLLIILALTGCAAGGGVSGSGQGGSAGAVPTLTALVIEVATLVPANTVTLAPTATFEAAAALAATATPTPGTGGNPAPGPAMVEQGFRDCALTPGWVGCDPSTPKVAGRLAFVDPAGARVVVLDLESGASWQVASRPSRLDWSPDGSQLLLTRRSEGGNVYELFSAEGVVQDPPTTDVELRWQPDGTLDSILAVHSPEGDVALLEYAADTRWRMHVLTKDGQSQTLEIEPEPTDRMYLPATWVPGTNEIIVQRYYPSNSAMLTGLELVTINTETGEQQPLEAAVPIGEAAVYAWQPGTPSLAQQPSELALTAVLGGGRPTTTLALLDPATMQARYPLPESVQVREPVWTPDGARLVFGAAPRQPVGSFPGPGIYQLDPATGTVERLTEPATNLMDDWPQSTANADVLVFARSGSLPSGETRVDIMGKRLSDGVEWVIVRELTLPGGGLVIPWDRYFAFGIK